MVGGEEKEGVGSPAVLILEAARPPAVLVLISKGTRPPAVMLSVPPAKSTSNRQLTKAVILAGDASVGISGPAAKIELITAVRPCVVCGRVPAPIATSKKSHNP